MTSDLCREAASAKVQIQGNDQDAESVDAAPMYYNMRPMQGDTEVAPPVAGMR